VFSEATATAADGNEPWSERPSTVCKIIHWCSGCGQHHKAILLRPELSTHPVSPLPSPPNRPHCNETGHHARTAVPRSICNSLLRLLFLLAPAANAAVFGVSSNSDGDDGDENKICRDISSASAGGSVIVFGGASSSFDGGGSGRRRRAATATE